MYRLYNVHGFPYTTDTFLKYLSHCMGLPGLKVICLFFFRIWRPEYLFIYLLGDVGQDIYFQLYPGLDIYLEKKLPVHHSLHQWLQQTAISTIFHGSSLH